MKFTKVLMAMLLSLSAFAGGELIEAKDTALSQVLKATDRASIFAWKVSLEGHDVNTQVLSTDGKSVENRSFDCHPHGASMYCHYKGLDAHHEEIETSKLDYQELLEVEKAAISFIKNSLRAGGSSFEKAVEGYQVWKQFEHAHKSGGHNHGGAHEHKDGTGWAKFHFEYNGQDREIYTECHRHLGETHFVCHPALKVKGEEPEFEEGHGHAH